MHTHETYEKGIARALLDQHLNTQATDTAVNAFHWSVVHGMPVERFEQITPAFIDGWLAAYRWGRNPASPAGVAITVDTELAQEVAIRHAERAREAFYTLDIARRREADWEKTL
jgi:hypothetical protein